MIDVIYKLLQIFPIFVICKVHFLPYKSRRLKIFVSVYTSTAIVRVYLRYIYEAVFKDNSNMTKN